MAEKAAVLLAAKQSQLFTPFDKFYEQRHTILHYPKTPMYLTDGLLQSASNGESTTDWRQNMRWSDLNPKHFKMVADLVSNTLRDLEQVCDVYLGAVYGILKANSFKEVEWSSTSAAFLQHINEKEKTSILPIRFHRQVEWVAELGVVEIAFL